MKKLINLMKSYKKESLIRVWIHKHTTISFDSRSIPLTYYNNFKYISIKNGIIDVGCNISIRNTDIKELPYKFGSVNGLFNLQPCPNIQSLHNVPTKAEALYVNQCPHLREVPPELEQIITGGNLLFDIHHYTTHTNTLIYHQIKDYYIDTDNLGKFYLDYDVYIRLKREILLKHFME
jgi:hypothetical protein